MKYVALLIISTLIVFSESNSLSFQYTSLKTKKDPVNDFLSIYFSLENTFSLHSGNIELKAGVTALGILDKSGDFELFDTVSQSKILFHALSLDYYPTADSMISIGRQSLDFNLMHGSFDGLMASVNIDGFMLKTFCFNRYATLYPSYYESKKLDKLYGVNLYYQRDVYEIEISHFSYWDHYVDNIYFGLNKANYYAGAEYFSFRSDSLDSEKAFRLYGGYKFADVYMEIGLYNIYEGGLENIYALGGMKSSQPRLYGFLNRPDTKKMYTSIEYNKDDFYTRTYFAYAEFKNKTGNNYHGSEIGVTVGKRYNDFEFSATYLAQKNNEIDSSDESISWFQTEIKYRF